MSEAMQGLTALIIGSIFLCHCGGRLCFTCIVPVSRNVSLIQLEPAGQSWIKLDPWLGRQLLVIEFIEYFACLVSRTNQVANTSKRPDPPQHQVSFFRALIQSCNAG
eukprot:TRINITY_DN12451_c0_g1_i1.p3 TRINITY_DN12451_c0_g1~~TRINITY_DN12451_c0_g1_i1.p3  ORF type:complete len:107 (+),score=4.69 TRINITY_DN12451_c0_g1_i1:753-1073(+)